MVIAAVAAIAFLFLRNKLTGNETTQEAGHFITAAPEEDTTVYVDLADAKTGDLVHFGSYDEEIAWKVLDVKKDKILLISNNCVEQKPYNDSSKKVTWETSDIRNWLNNTFYKKAFSEEEQGQILKTTVKNPDNTAYGTKGGKTTKDYLFLLSIDEASTYFTETSERGATLADGTSIWYWLRSPGFQEDDAANIGEYGNITTAGHAVYNEYVTKGGVRPVMWVSK